MGMGYGANFADTIKHEDVLSIGDIAKLWASIEVYLMEHDISFDEFAYAAAHDYFDSEFGTIDEVDTLMSIFQKVRDEFHKETGLDLDLSHHDSDNDGDRYDEVHGGFWIVDGLFEYTPEARALMARGIKPVRAFYVTMG